MAKITDERDLPPWYKPSRYKDLKLAKHKGEPAYEHIVNEISLRKDAYEELYPDLVKSIFQEAGFRHLIFQNELFKEREPYKAKEQVDLKIDVREALASVKTMEIRDLDILSSEIKELELHQNTVFDKDEYVHKALNTASILCSTQAKISIDLRFATNTEILNELKELLPILRNDIDNNEPKRYKFKDKYDLLFSCCVFEYLDLTLWAKAHGHKLSNKFLARILKDGSFTPKQISEKVKKHAMHALSEEFMEQLHLHHK